MIIFGIFGVKHALWMAPCPFPLFSFFCRQDVRQRDEFLTVFGHCESFFKGDPVEVLINNAGVVAADDYETVLDINLMGVMHGTVAFLQKYGISKVPAVQAGPIFVHPPTTPYTPKVS